MFSTVSYGHSIRIHRNLSVVSNTSFRKKLTGSLDLTLYFISSLYCYGNTGSLIGAILTLTAPIIHQTMVSRSDDDRCTADAHPSLVNGLLEIILDAYRGKTAKRKILYKNRMIVDKELYLSLVDLVCPFA